MKTLYLGLRCPDKNFDHFPLIRICPFSRNNPIIKKSFKKLFLFSHIILTSPTSVNLFVYYEKKISKLCLKKKQFIAIGESTKNKLRQQGIHNILLPSEATSEGLISLLNTLILKNSSFFYPKSTLARPLIFDFLTKEELTFISFPFYKTFLLKKQLPMLTKYSRIIFTSPSIVEAFFTLNPFWPKNIECISIGPITHQALKKKELLLK